jgi:hypothetical protein
MAERYFFLFVSWFTITLRQNFIPYSCIDHYKRFHFLPLVPEQLAALEREKLQINMPYRYE